MLVKNKNKTLNDVLHTRSLATALLNNDLEVFYQPKYSINTGEIIGAEALLRWYHTEIGFVPPSQFIPLAEKTALIEQIGDYVLKEVCSKIAELKQKNFEIPISLNFAKRNLLVEGVDDIILSYINDYQLSSDLIEIEITENVPFQDPRIDKTLRMLADKGIRLAVDDFGRGKSSIVNFSNPNLHIIKLDKLFMDKIDDENNRLVIKTIVELAHKLKKRIICEGVETREQLSFLKSISCKEVQGFLFSRPLNSKDFDSKLERNRLKFEAFQL